LLYWLKRSRDLAAARSTEIIEEIADEALSVMEVDESGLDDNDRRYLTALATFNEGRPVGVKVLAADIGLPVDSIEKLIEPYLIQKHYIVRTYGGRLLTRAGRVYLFPHLKKASNPGRHGYPVNRNAPG
jgi:holliday junction DNA helicase RuvB